MEPLVPDLTALLAAPTTRVSKHNFKDGYGRVPAHKHENGGGWVANTAYVAPTVKVARGASVFGNARVYNSCKIAGKARVFGGAQLFDAVTVDKTAQIYGQAIVRGGSVVTDNAIVCGAAHVYNASRIANNALIDGSALIDACRVTGPSFGGVATVRDNAKLSRCTVVGPSDIGGATQAMASTLQAAICRGNAIVISSYIYTVFTHDTNRLFLSETIAKEQCPGVSLEYLQQWISDRVHEIAIRIENANVIRSTIEGRWLSLRGGNDFLGCTVRYLPETREEAAPVINALNTWHARRGRATPVYNQNNIDTRQEFEAAIDSAVNGPTGAPLGTVTRTAEMPNLDQVRQRRLLRFEEAGT